MHAFMHACINFSRKEIPFVRKALRLQTAKDQVEIPENVGQHIKASPCPTLKQLRSRHRP
jgi:hypothetical protein